jgi:hypothetical protein
MGLLVLPFEFMQLLVDILHVSTDPDIVVSEGIGFYLSVLTFFPEANVTLLNPVNVKSDVRNVLMKQLLPSGGLVEGMCKLLKLGFEFCFGNFPVMGSEDRPHPGNSLLQILPPLL